MLKRQPISYSSSFKRREVEVLDNALPKELFHSLRRYAQNAQYREVVNPVDGVAYPDICPEVPSWIQIAIQSKIAKMMECPYHQLEVHTQFFRLTRKSSPPAPHGAHNDKSHSDYASFYYINDVPPDLQDEAGTALVSHKKTGMRRQPRDQGELEIWQRDTNVYDAWNIDRLIKFVPNRLAIYDSERMHRAEPPGGWGEDPYDGRLVLITFFSC